MESPLYLSLPLEERHSLLERVAESYPDLFNAGDIDDEEEEVGYGSSWEGISSD
jgi:hypothetical protein